jgi:hypothetical protein
MSRIKRYRLLKGLQLMTHFDVNGAQVPVTFSRGNRSPELVRGSFNTNDEALQEAIEKSKGFNVQYKLEYTGDDIGAPVNSGKPVDEPPAVPSDATPNDAVPGDPVTSDVTPGGDAVPPANDPPSGDDSGKITDYPDVPSVTQAKQKLIELFPDVKISTLKNKNDVLRVAVEKKVSFSKLK